MQLRSSLPHSTVSLWSTTPMPSAQSQTVAGGWRAGHQVPRSVPRPTARSRSDGLGGRLSEEGGCGCGAAMVTSKDSMICAVWDLDKAGERCHPVDTSASMRSPRFRLGVTPRSLPFVKTLIGPTLSWRQAGHGVEAACAGPFPTGVGTLPPIRQAELRSARAGDPVWRKPIGSARAGSPYQRLPDGNLTTRPWPRPPLSRPASSLGRRPLSCVHLEHDAHAVRAEPNRCWCIASRPPGRLPHRLRGAGGLGRSSHGRQEADVPME